MADVTIGGAVYSVSLQHFKKLKQAWKHIAAVQGAADPMDSITAILGIVSVGASEPITLDQLEDALLSTEMKGLRTFLNELMIESGLAVKPEDADPLAVTASPSTETSEPSSTSLSPQAAEA